MHKQGGLVSGLSGKTAVAQGTHAKSGTNKGGQKAYKKKNQKKGGPKHSLPTFVFGTLVPNTTKASTRHKTRRKDGKKHRGRKAYENDTKNKNKGTKKVPYRAWPRGSFSFIGKTGVGEGNERKISPNVLQQTKAKNGRNGEKKKRKKIKMNPFFQRIKKKKHQKKPEEGRNRGGETEKSRIQSSCLGTYTPVKGGGGVNGWQTGLGSANVRDQQVLGQKLTGDKGGKTDRYVPCFGNLVMELRGEKKKGNYSGLSCAGEKGVW